MKKRPRIYYSASQRTLIWERWRKGETLHQSPGCLIDTTRRSKASWLSRAGSVQPSSVYPREVVTAALAHNAAAVIFAHTTLPALQSQAGRTSY